MSFESRIDEATLSVLLDVRHPLCYLALAPTIEFGRARAIEINWLPVEVSPLHAPSKPAAGDDRGIRHRRHRAQMIAREIAVYAEAQGLEMVDYYRDAPAPAVRAAWLWVRERAGGEALERFLQDVFRAYWCGELDPADVGAVADRIAEAAPAADASAFRDWTAGAGATVADGLASELVTRGLAGAPLYAVADQIFLGRQHLPMIGWLLDGQAGPGPI